jgi:hypothetical protein
LTDFTVFQTINHEDAKMALDKSFNSKFTVLPVDILFVCKYIKKKKTKKISESINEYYDSTINVILSVTTYVSCIIISLFFLYEVGV